MVKVPVNPHVSQDASGVWWYAIPSHPRSRMKLAVCAWCQGEFLNYPTKRNTHCSRSCSLKCQASGGRHCKPKSYNFATREGNGAWRGGRWTGVDGYVRVYVGSTDTGRNDGRRRAVYQLEHRVVMEGELGRPLTKDETVHHKNGIKDDNRRENLELWVYPRHQPAGQRRAEARHCETCTCFEE